uniref:Uncharacterized protein n=1 Tax=Cacopsylla melanoneura TaxID=428564 RepID=A0A8D9E5M1_9HEMI
MILRLRRTLAWTHRVVRSLLVNKLKVASFKNSSWFVVFLYISCPVAIVLFCNPHKPNIRITYYGAFYTTLYAFHRINCFELLVLFPNISCFNSKRLVRIWKS